VARTIRFTIGVHAEGLWARVQPELHDPEDAHVSQILRWVLEQMNFGQWAHTTDDQGRLTSVAVGLPLAATGNETTVDAYAERVRTRLAAVNFAGVFARAREEGIDPSTHDLAEKVRLTATEEGGYRNTEMHYAFELLDILAGIRRNTFVFKAPPIAGVAAPEVLAILREATRAYLFNQMRSCVSLCRSLVEASLESRVEKREIAEERQRTRLDKGTLECLIDVASRRGILKRPMAAQAHEIRKLGNRVLHARSAPAPERVWAVLLDTREIVESVYAKRLR
jgi:hypothetical protein